MFRFQAPFATLSRRQSTFAYKKWVDLETSQRQQFIKGFVENYRKQYPGSKTNVSLKGLALGMEDHADAPTVFGIFYDDIWGLCKKSKESLYSGEKSAAQRNDIKQTGRFGHESFYDLLVGKEGDH
ncbi:Mlo1p [Lachancea thermotolerans CBS 6340]|uniref:KLTH0C04774p n=1 Tax=Lachancea thermotolerans (strain ATCC 56472 / CBS 6340 / NRRL Y-8284) TaxID=559295 RepID=C5DDY3_LACTC|nr:KLTH0C04774p [Lachancea thermotolerans CBS 6340]CAR21994.1 KLTH0C04774p [Lachancea thermotolerans CBS 6340]